MYPESALRSDNVFRSVRRKRRQLLRMRTQLRRRVYDPREKKARRSARFESSRPCKFSESQVGVETRRIVSSLLRRPRSSSTGQRVKVITRHASRPVASSCTLPTDSHASSPKFILYRRFTDIHYPLAPIFTSSRSSVCFSSPCYAAR